MPMPEIAGETIAEIYREGVGILRGAGVESPSFDAVCLLKRRSASPAGAAAVWGTTGKSRSGGRVPADGAGAGRRTAAAIYPRGMALLGSDAAGGRRGAHPPRGYRNAGAHGSGHVVWVLRPAGAGSLCRQRGGGPGAGTGASGGAGMLRGTVRRSGRFLAGKLRRTRSLRCGMYRGMCWIRCLPHSFPVWMPL